MHQSVWRFSANKGVLFILFQITRWDRTISTTQKATAYFGLVKIVYRNVIYMVISTQEEMKFEINKQKMMSRTV